MWERIDLKNDAKNILKRTYWMGFVVCLLSGFLISIGSEFINIYLRLSETFNTFSINIFLSLFIFSITFSIFISNPIIVGSNVYFMKSRVNNPNISDLFSIFVKDKYFNIVKTMFFTQLYITLWSLLLIIPGIIKSYQYTFVPYILSENPTLSCDRALELSCDMTKGIKMKIFILQISFLGWILLGLICCCIGELFVVPYMHATFAELYAFEREKALTEGYANTTELCGYSL